MFVLPNTLRARNQFNASISLLGFETTKFGSICPIIIIVMLPVYSIPRGGEMGCLNGHQQLVYDIRWSRNDDRVVSASADGTAQ